MTKLNTDDNTEDVVNNNNVDKYYMVFVPSVLDINKIRDGDLDAEVMFRAFDSLEGMARFVASRGGLCGLCTSGEGNVFFFKGTRLAISKGSSPFNHVCDPVTGATAPLFHIPGISGPLSFESDLNYLDEEEQEEEEEEKEEEASLK